MTTFTDGTHVVSDRGLNELHAWAKAAGIGRSRFQAHPRHPHYDLPKYMRGQPLQGVATVASRDLVRVLRGQSFGEADLSEGGGDPGRRVPKHLLKCGFCGRPFDEKNPSAGYVYPVAPEPGQEYDGSDGRQACGTCHPIQIKRSVDSGRLVLYSVPADPAIVTKGAAK